jgi:hypothetical protein
VYIAPALSTVKWSCEKKRARYLFGVRPIRELVLEEIERQGMTVADVGRRMAEARGTEPVGVTVTLRQVLAGSPRSPGARERQIGEGLLREICAALGVHVALVPAPEEKSNVALDRP